MNVPLPLTLTTILTAIKKQEKAENIWFLFAVNIVVRVSGSAVVVVVDVGIEGMQ